MKRIVSKTVVFLLLFSSAGAIADEYTELDLYSAAVIKLVKKYKKMNKQIKNVDHDLYAMQHRLKPVLSFKYQNYNEQNSKIIEGFVDGKSE